jgi:hypothetical protein
MSRLEGRIVLNRNPENYFAEVERAAFNPAHFVPQRINQIAANRRCVLTESLEQVIN